jgi:hypothetical protein
MEPAKWAASAARIGICQITAAAALRPRAFAWLGLALCLEKDLPHLLATQSEFIANAFKRDALRPARANSLIALDVLRARAASAIELGGQPCMVLALRHGGISRCDLAILRQIRVAQYILGSHGVRYPRA